MRDSSRWWMVAAVSGALSLADGCNCGHRGGNLQTQVGIPQNVSTLNFGNVAVGQTLWMKLQVTNIGAGVLDFESQNISGPPFTEPTKLPASLPPGGKDDAVITFAPTVAGPVTGKLTFTDDGEPTSVTVTLEGTGLDLNVTASPTALSFGQVPVGTRPSPSQTVTFENHGTTPLYITLATHGTASQYAVTGPGNSAITATPVRLLPSTPYVVSVTFTPDAVSVFNSSFTFTACQDQTSATCLQPQSVPLSGKGVTGVLALTPSPVTWMGIPQGTSASRTVTITNVGGAQATPSCIYLKSLGPTSCGTPSAVFTLGQPSIALPTALAPGATLNVAVTYHSTGGVDADVLAVTYLPQFQTTPATATDDLQAGASMAPCALSIAPTSLNFTYLDAGVPVNESVTLTNAGISTCSVTAIAIDPSSDPAFSLTPGQAPTLTIAAGGTAPIGVSFELAATGRPTTRRGTLGFQSNDSLHTSVAVPLLASVESAYAGGGAWPRWHHDNTQSGLSPVDTTWLAGTVAWTVSVGAPGTNMWTGAPTDYMNSPVVGADGTIYQVGNNGTLYAVTPTGTAIWSTPLEGPLNDPHPSTPIIAADGSLFVAFGDTEQAGLSYGLFHVSPAGTILASMPPSGAGDGFDLPPMLTNGGLLLGADDASNNGTGAGAFAYKINADGSLTVAAQSAMTSSYDQISAVVGPDDTTYWCAGSDCTAMSPPASGMTPIPSWSTAAVGGLGNTPPSANSDLALDVGFTGNLMILFGGMMPSGTGAQQLISLNPQTVQIAWTLNLPPPSAAQQAMTFLGIADSTDGNACPAIGADGTVYVGNFDGLHAVDGATGVEKPGFPFLTNGSDVLTAPAIGGDGTVFFGTADGTFYAVHPDGSLRFKLSAGGRIAGSPAIGPNGAVYFTANDGNLYAVN